MDPSNVTSEDLEDTVVDKASEEVTRTRKLTEKGLQYQVNLKTKNLKDKRHEFIRQVRSTMLLRGQNEHVDTIKHEFSKAQVLFGEFHDIFGDIRDIVSGEELISDAVRVFLNRLCVNGRTLKKI